MSMQKLNLTNKYVIDWEEDRKSLISKERATKMFVELQNAGKINKSFILRQHNGSEHEDPTWFIYYRDQYSVEALYELKSKNSKKIDKKLESNSVNTKFSTFTTESPFQQNMKDLAMEYCQNPIGFMFLSAPTKRGKTHIAKASLRSLAKQDRSFGYLNWNEWMTNLKANFNSLREEIDKYVNQEVLVIEDLFSSSNLKFLTQFEESATGELIRKRYERDDLLTIITSTKSIKEIINLNESIGSMIFEKSTSNNLHIKVSESYNYILKKGNNYEK